MKQLAILVLVFLASSCAPTVQDDSETIRALVQRINELESQLSDFNRNDLSNTTNLLASKGDATKIENWRKLKIGMTEQQVLNLLGEPENIFKVSTSYIWYYPNFSNVSFWNGFDTTVGKVDGWKEP